MTLQERLRAMTEPCREVDAEIFNKMFLHTGAHAVRAGGEWLVDTQGTEHGTCIPHYTASLDAVVEQVERELPGVSWSVGDAGPHVPGYSAEIREDAPEDGDRWRTKAQYSDIPAVALLLALIEAKDVSD